jgi:hypothetical protein
MYYISFQFVRLGEPERGVPLAAGVFAPDGPNELGGPTSPCDPSGANELMYALWD